MKFMIPFLMAVLPAAGPSRNHSPEAGSERAQHGYT